MNDFFGVFGVPDPARALRSQGIAPAWSDAEVAFGGAPIWTDASGSIVVSGEVVLDNAEELRGMLDRPRAEAGELLAELAACSESRVGLAARGMYAVALWNTRDRTLTLLRDGMGARTLYYAVQGRACWFGARLRALRRCPAVSGDLSLTALRNYLTCAFVPGVETMWRDVQELRPGTTMTWPGHKMVSHWEPAEAEHAWQEPMEAHATRLRPLLEDAVRVCLPATGPTSIFLSGGLDSSLVTALAVRHAPGPVHTFAIHFGPDYPNELEHSHLVAQHCGTRHHVVALPGKRIRNMLPETMAALDDPIGDPLTTPNLILGRAAAQESGVVLNGEGGDPCFGGPKNMPMLLHELYGHPGGRAAAYLRAFQKGYDDLPYLLAPDVQQVLRSVPPQEDFFASYLEDPATHYLNRLMYVNTRFKGTDNILTKVNNLTSACGLLGRSPLFDRRVVQASFGIPPEFKLSGAREKAVLKHAVADLLPDSILNRPKSGMLVPVQAWFQRDLRRMARSLLLSRRARIRPYIRPDLIREWLSYRSGPWPRSGVKLWLLLTLELWLQAQE